MYIKLLDKSDTREPERVVTCRKQPVSIAYCLISGTYCRATTKLASFPG